MPIEDDDIRWLLSFADAENLEEIEVRDGDCRVMIRRRLSTPAQPNIPAAATTMPPAPEPALPDNVVPLVAPMSGVFYRGASPESPPYVEVGQQVEVGDIVGLIEAMKLFNDVTATVAGTVYKILVGNEEQVEPGRPLMLIQTAPT